MASDAVDTPNTITLQPVPKKLATQKTSNDLERACETKVLTPHKSDLTGHIGDETDTGLGFTACTKKNETLTLTLNDPENFEYAISLLQNSSNLFDQVYK